MTLYGEQGSVWSMQDKEPYNTLVNTVLYIGAFVGTLVAFLCVSHSSPQVGKRRNSGIYLFNGFCIVGGILTAILNLPILFVGRFVHGLGAGCLTYLIPIMSKPLLSFSQLSLPSSYQRQCFYSVLDLAHSCYFRSCSFRARFASLYLSDLRVQYSLESNGCISCSCRYYPDPLIFVFLQT